MSHASKHSSIKQSSSMCRRTNVLTSACIGEPPPLPLERLMHAKSCRTGKLYQVALASAALDGSPVQSAEENSRKLKVTPVEPPSARRRSIVDGAWTSLRGRISRRFDQRVRSEYHGAGTRDVLPHTPHTPHRTSNSPSASRPRQYTLLPRHHSLS